MIIMSKKKEHPAETATETATDTAAPETEAAAVQEQQGGEPDAPEPQDETPQTPEERIGELTADLKNANDRYLRLMAEFDNYKKRTSREYERLIESANEKLMLEMIAVRETFELAIKHGENGSDYQQLFDGVKLLFQKFDGVLAANGLTPFAAPGDGFDPQLHDALLKVPNADIPEDHIADIHEKGYKLKERVVKHARVIVSAGAPDASADGSDEKKK